jgi:glycerate kinase
VAAPDKFRGTATASAAAAAIGRAGRSRGWTVVEAPLSDGGEGLIDALAPLGGTIEHAEVTGPLGHPVTARWLLDGSRAVIEMAEASGLLLAGGSAGNRPMEATTLGTGELMVLAARAVGPAGTVVVGLGGSATTDGGAGAVEAVDRAGGLGGATLVGACDVEVGFLEAATRFAPQKGADAAQVVSLEARLATLAGTYRDRTGTDVLHHPGAGAAGGLGGALVVLGGTLRSGYRLVADLVGLPDHLRRAGLVVTGEGALDATSFDGKVVGGVLADAGELGLDTLVVVGRAADDGTRLAGEAGAPVVSLRRLFGGERAVAQAVPCIESAVGAWLDERAR